MILATASTAVKFHEFPSGTVNHHYQPGSQIDGAIRSISWSKDGNWLALVPYSGQTEIVSVRTQLKLIHTIQGIEEPSCASFQNTTKKNIAIGTRSGQVYIYDIKSRNVKKRFPRISSVVTHVEFNAKDSHIVAGYSNGEAHLYSNVTNNLTATFKIPKSNSINALRTNPIKRNLVAGGSGEGVLAVWDINTNKAKFVCDAHKAPITSVAFSPIHSDLVLSTGLDRQFCFYDLGGNKCITNVFVENCMTAADFSPEGKFIAMASQNGKVHIYDSRKLSEPMHVFLAHNTMIKHLAFRKCEETDGSVCSGIFDNVKQHTSEDKLRRASDSFGLGILPAVPVEDAGNDGTDGGDSFIAEMGLDKSNNNTGSIKHDVSDHSKTSPIGITINDKPTVPLRTLHENFVQFDNKIQRASTPKYAQNEMSGVLSPIVPKQSTCHCNQINLDSVVKEAVKEELSGLVNEMKKEMKYYSTHILSETRQLYLNQMMAIVKESIKVENTFNTLRSDLICEMPPSQEALYEENVMLKQRISSLESQLENLKTNSKNY